jgi:hypothetical protein
VEWSLLAPLSGGPYRAFPVFISLEVEQPESLAHLRYLLHTRLQQAMDRWQKVRKAESREVYERFLRQASGFEIAVGPIKLKLPTLRQHAQQLLHDDFRRQLSRRIARLRQWQFEGVCFLLDEAEFIVRQPWANAAWSYFRGLKDTDTALKPFVGLLLSGYRDVKEYEQRVGSPLLNIASVEWLAPLREAETRALMARRSEDERAQLREEDRLAVLEWAGCHPYLTQQTLNTVFDSRQTEPPPAAHSLMPELLRQHDRNFAGWWNADQRSDGFGDSERAVYQALMGLRAGTAENLAQHTAQSPLQTADALQVLVGTGVIRQVDDERYTIGARLFEAWVTQRRPAS